MKALFAIVIMGFVWFNTIPPAIASADTHLVPCQESTAFMENLQNAPKSYYFDQPYQAYSKNLLCGEDGLPHLQLRLDRAIDIAIPFAIFFYFAGFVGWSGRAYLINSKKASKPEEMEIFINIPLVIQSFIQGLLWPLAAIRELTTKELTAKDSDLSVSPR